MGICDSAQGCAKRRPAFKYACNFRVEKQVEGRLALSEPEWQGEGWKVRSGTKPKRHSGSKVDDHFTSSKNTSPRETFFVY